ncbi:conserved hypothetical protein [Planktothrix sp. PCC 11201]|uniref:hypothetical protein n=1 Tax=Planktothrix sp. PCC 11201 TaxID=1729650 RepID=UPI000912C18A|nr:hypothetical protein [Planktothrix sp. PCC 11201]SKB14205.1 conserved hypothetical protein [Planktothrix sp. PCC 11201]
MQEIHKNYIVDENQNPIAEFEKIEEILENYFLGKMMEDEEDAEILSPSEAVKYYQGLKENNLG